MKYLYFTRHGQTVWNVENKICGATDIELTDLGRAQAKELGERLKAQGPEIHKILYSPLIRAAETAGYISQITGIPMEEEPRLREQNFGRFEATARNGKEFTAAKTNFVDSYGTGETMLKLAQRIYNLLDELKDDSKTYLLVAHNGIARVVNSYFNDMSNEAYASFGIKNCQLIRYDFDELKL